MNMDTIVEKWFSTRDQKITWSISLAFFIIFPIYFANLGSFLPDDAMINDAGGIDGKWNVMLEETVEDGDSEEADMEDGEIYELEFSYEDLAPNLAYIEITVSHDESNENGPLPSSNDPCIGACQCDTVDVELNMDDIGGYVVEDSTTTSSSSDCPSEQVLRIYMIANYTGEGGEMEGTKNGILAMYDDGDQGRGDWAGDITLTVNTGGTPGPSGNRDNGETVTIEWKVVSVEVSVTPVVDIMS
ncbi:MAG: hypothetical protein OSB33_02105 [Candidatus Poseidoniales archaeon]|nr:hypothetical protein [Candidatus Poseidoniales archaeon]